MYSIVLAVFLSFACLANGFNVENCGTWETYPDELKLVGCHFTEKYCVLVKGESATIKMNFTLNSDVEKLLVVVNGIIMGGAVRFFVPYTNACENPDSGVQCPLTKGGSYRAMTTLPIHLNYPSLTLTVKWELQDERGNEIACVQIPVKIQASE